LPALELGKRLANQQTDESGPGHNHRAFTEEQTRWLELIRRHLTKTLFIEKDDVDSIFTREGGSWAELNKVFGGELEVIIHEINEAIAA